MSLLFINLLKITCLTNGGRFGCEIPFQSGLNIIRAENSSGKSTCLNTILYALGLEAILGRSGNQALKPAVKTELEYKNKLYRILESYVEVEITNQENESITIKRHIVGEQDDRLIIVNKGRRLSNNSDFHNIEEYYFVRDSGAAQRERGFHRFLANFLNLQLPKVETYDDSEVPLYLECIFPSFFIEQRRGWSNIQATIPSKFRIRNVAKQATEFILALDVSKNEKIRKEIEIKKTKIKNDWQRVYDTLQVYAQQVGGILNGFPTLPTSSFDELENARIFKIEANKHLILDDWIYETRSRLIDLKESFVEDNRDFEENNNNNLKEELRNLENSLLFYEASANEASDDFYSEEANRNLLIERLISFEEDLTKNKDALKLKKFGASIQTSVAEGECPTCHQPIEDSLLEQPKAQVPMTVETNIEFIKQQKEVVKSLLKKSDEALNIKRAVYVSKQETVAQIRQKIQDIKTNLTQDKKLPNISHFRDIINTEEKLNNAISIRDKFSQTLEDTHLICEEWKNIRSQESQLPKDFFSELDKDKLNKFAELFRLNIINFGFRSEDPASITISKDTYRPTIEGFEMAFDASASDNIRLIWAYTLALQELNDFYSTNHLKISFFDEPGQQQVNAESRRALYKKIGKFNFSHQFITTTSEAKDRLPTLLENVPHILFEFDTKVLKPMDE